MMNDSISRKAATTIPVMPKEHRHYQTNNLDDAYEQGWNDLQECIENLPPAQSNTGELINRIRREINSKNRNSADYFIVDRIESIVEEWENEHGTD